MKKNITQERMRYLVPNEVNNFWSAHRRFIFLCTILTVVIFVLALSLAVIINIQKLEPKISFVFCCEVDDYDSVVASTEKYTDKYAIYFIRYEDQFKKLDGGNDNTYDLSSLGLSENFDITNWQYSDELLYVMNKDLSYKYTTLDLLRFNTSGRIDFNWTPGTILNAEAIINIIESVASIL